VRSIFSICRKIAKRETQVFVGSLPKDSLILGKKICRQLPKDSLSFAIVYFGSVPKDSPQNSHLSCRQLAER
jgi:hypothetical protein